ncbi:MAG: phosphate transport system substrate-binding protein [Clostridiales bacterium]|nr:phosphate transport system substrate-binding protein [Clostridiales bacterium]
MKKNWSKLAALTLITALSITALAGCQNKTADSTTTTTETTQEATPDNTAADTTATDTTATDSALSGSITMAGSTSMEKLATALSEAFMKENSGVTVNAEFIGSSAGIESLIAGNVQIGNASRELKDDEISAGAVPNVVAIDGIAVITDTSNKVTALTTEDLTKIYKGEVTNWKDLGGDNMPIVVVGREAGSGTRGAFEELLGIEDQCAYANELDSTGAVMAKVASTKGSIGYVSLDILDDTVTAMSLDGVAPSEDTIKAGDYSLSRPFIMATMGEISAQTPEVQALFDYLKSDAGKELIKSVGLIIPD